MAKELLAPNGKPSNLTPAQYKLVRTPAFKKWFGDWENDPENSSKVIDDNGEPLVVYHGTNKKFNIFKINERTPYSFFAKNKEYAETYTDDEYSVSNPKMHECFLNIRTPFDTSKNYEFNNESLYLYYFLTKLIYKDVKEGKIILPQRYYLDNKKEELKEFIENQNTKFGSVFWFVLRKDGNNYNDYLKGYNKEYAEKNKKKKRGFLKNFLQYLNYDGVVQYENVYGEEVKVNYKKIADKEKDYASLVFAVFNSNQIKLADGTNTTFDSNNDDIRFEQGGDIDYSNYKTAVIALFNDNKVLILKRGSTANWFPNKWSLVGGVVENDENPKKAVIRETFEEIGLTPENVVFDKNIKDKRLGNMYYYYGSLESTKVNLDYENSDYAFISESEIDNYDYVPYVKDYIKKLFANNVDVRFAKGGEIDNFIDFYNELKIEDGSKYIGQKFGSVFPFLGKKRIVPNDYRIMVKQYDGVLSRLEQNNFSSKTIKQRDLNKLERIKNNIDKKKYLANFYLDGTGTIVEFKTNEFAYGGEVLLAPNGKPSNLNAEQYELVRTPAFKKWFGDWEKDPANASKVVDENGEPLVCQHRTNEKFNIFDKNKAGTKTDSGYFGKGFYFSPKGLGSISYGLNIIYCFLNIKNPKYINSYDIQPNNTHNVIVLRGEYDFILHKKLLKEESKEIQEIVVFEPNQIKLANGTNTTFDSENDDIRFYDGGMIEDLINKGIVELKFYETTPKHAREYGLISKKPIYLQTLFVSENIRLKGVGKQVLEYLENYAKNNGNDLIFGHINNKAQFTKDDRETFFSDVDMIRHWLHNNGYAINEDNNDFHKLIRPNENIRFAKGGITESSTPDYLRMFLGK